MLPSSALPERPEILMKIGRKSPTTAAMSSRRVPRPGDGARACADKSGSSASQGIACAGGPEEYPGFDAGPFHLWVTFDHYVCSQLAGATELLISASKRIARCV